jgi:hypothetical protein
VAEKNHAGAPVDARPPAQGAAPARPGTALTVEQTMAAFVAALYAEDAKRLLTFFPPTGTWRLVFGGAAAEPGRGPRTVRYSEIVRNGKPTALFMETFFTGDEPFVQYAQGSRGRRWEKRGPDLFGPPDLASVPVHVRWRLHGSRFVVDEIALLGS